LNCPLGLHELHLLGLEVDKRTPSRIWSHATLCIVDPREHIPSRN